MAITLLEYSSQFDQLVKQAVESHLQTKVNTVTRLPMGEYNFSFKVCSSEAPAIVRIFRCKDFPNISHLAWVEKQLVQQNIRHAQTLLATTESTLFPYGYMIQEYVEGQSGFEAIIGKHIGFEEFFDAFISLLHKIHQIEVEPAATETWLDTNQTFYQAAKRRYDQTTTKLGTKSSVPAQIQQAVLAEIEKLKQSSYTYKLSLLHGDPTADNAIINKLGEIILIDWDNAYLGSWIEEYALITLRGAFLWQYSTESERNLVLDRIFQRVYTEINFQSSEIKFLARIFRILFAYEAVAAHYQQNQDGLYQAALNRLELLLKS